MSIEKGAADRRFAPPFELQEVTVQVGELVGGYFLLFINKANVAKEMSTIRNWNSPSYVTTFIRATPFP